MYLVTIYYIVRIIMLSVWEIKDGSTEYCSCLKYILCNLREIYKSLDFCFYCYFIIPIKFQNTYIT